MEVPVKKLVRHLPEEKEASLSLAEAIKGWLADNGYSPIFGARPLRRVMQKELENRLAVAILNGKINNGDQVIVDCRNDKLAIGVKAKVALRLSRGVAKT